MVFRGPSAILSKCVALVKNLGQNTMVVPAEVLALLSNSLDHRRSTYLEETMFHLASCMLACQHKLLGTHALDRPYTFTPAHPVVPLGSGCRSPH